MQQFMDILKKQLAAYEELLILVQEKQILLIGNEIKQLENLNKNEQKLLLRITRLENQRLQSLRDLYPDLTGSQLPTINQIAKNAQEADRDNLISINNRFNELVGLLDKINQENAALIEQALKYINFSMNILVNDDREITYSPGEKDGQKQSRIFDRKV